MSYHFNVRLRSMPADTLTPVGVYLRLRDLFPNTLLLESSDYNGNENSYSYICCLPAAGITLRQGVWTQYLPGGETHSSHPEQATAGDLSAFIQSFSFGETGKAYCNGRFFGHVNYDAVTCFETIRLRQRTDADMPAIPDIRLHVYQYVLIFDHVHHTLYLTAHYPEHEAAPGFERIEAALRRPHAIPFPFDTSGEETADATEREYRDMVRKGKAHCRKGDVFQLVLSRSFMQPFKGDDFNVYRALRMVNPSPYLFYFDYGDYRLFGSSPETQLRADAHTAVMYPIAGTCRREGQEPADATQISILMNDPKEQAEHTMLVDLARNDLSKSHDKVDVTFYKKVQRFAHVFHIVSEVTATLPHHNDPIRMIADTFPAGTLSGAPKYRAMQLIDQYEKTKRGYYGGSIGFLSPDGTLNQAIMIRSFMSCNNRLYYRAGAGIVDASSPRKELQEVADKLKGLRLAIEKARQIARPLTGASFPDTHAKQP